jgi:hypothetical protein
MYCSAIFLLAIPSKLIAIHSLQTSENVRAAVVALSPPFPALRTEEASYALPSLIEFKIHHRGGYNLFSHRENKKLEHEKRDIINRGRGITFS